MTEQPSECEFSTPAYEGAEFYRFCQFGCGCAEVGWKHSFLKCPIRKRAKTEGTEPPKPMIKPRIWVTPATFEAVR